MPCFHPINAYRSKKADGVTGRKSIIFKWRDGFSVVPIPLPCSRCIGCRLERSRQWALRCVHQVQLHPNNCFVTLTLDDDHLVDRYFTGHYRPDGRKVFGGTLLHKHFQDFAKRVRKKFFGNAAGNFSYYMCGEYGARYFRPHYHAILFGVHFDDLKVFKVPPHGSVVYTSATLARLWPLGFSTVGAATFESAAYVARYVMKKITGPLSEAHYRKVCQDTGEVFDLKPEYNRMSLKRPIAKGWYSQFKGDVYPRDEVIINGHKVRPPKYYDRLYELDATPREYKQLKEAREAQIRKHRKNATPKRLAVREAVKNQQVQLLPREIE